jgi:hypothetical protein
MIWAGEATTTTSRAMARRASIIGIALKNIRVGSLHAHPFERASGLAELI